MAQPHPRGSGAQGLSAQVVVFFIAIRWVKQI